MDKKYFVRKVDEMKRIVQTAGRNALNELSPEFAHFNDDVLFGENWNNQDIDRLPCEGRNIVSALRKEGF